MKFSSFAKLKWLFDLLEIQPTHAPEGALYWTKLYPHVLNSSKRKGLFTTIRAKAYWTTQIDKIVPISVDDHVIFDAKITGVKPIKWEEITEGLARGDADMTRDDLLKMLDYWYKDKDTGKRKQLYKITLRRV